MNKPGKRKLLLAAMLLAVAGGACWYFLRDDPSHEAIELNGNVDIREVDISFRVPGRLQNLSVDEGDPVKAGDTLGRMDPAPYELALKQAESNADALESQLAKMETGNRPEEIAEAAAQLETQKAQLATQQAQLKTDKATLAVQQAVLANAEINWKRNTELVKSNSLAQRELDNAVEARDKALSTIQAQEAAIAAREAAIRGCETTIKAYEAKYTLLKKGFRDEDIANARALARQARAAAEKAKLDLSDTQLVAPSDGIILTRTVEPGTMLNAGATVLTLSLRKPVWVRAYIDEPDFSRVHPGQKVTVRTDTGEEYEGTVGYISPKAEFTPKTIESRNLRTALVYRLRIIVDNPGKGLNQGMPVSIIIPKAG